MNERQKQLRRRRRLIHNIRAICLWIIIFFIFVMLISGLVSLVKKLFTKKDSSPQETALVTETETETQLPEEEVTVNDEFRILMVGDVLMHDSVIQAGKQEDGTYDYTAIFSNLKADIQAADLAMVNQEVIIAGDDIGISGYPKFNAPYELADALADAGFNGILHATNHTLDRGTSAVSFCLNNWHSKYPEISVLGIHNSSEESKVAYFEANGIKVGVINCTYGTNEELPHDQLYLLDLLDRYNTTSLHNAIQEARNNADFVIMCPHWGDEFDLGITDNQKYWNDFFLQEGVDLVIGTHTHVIGPVQTATNSSTGHQMLTYYSLGNFVAWTTSTGEGVMNRSVGAMADVTLERKASGEVVIKDHTVHGLVTHLTEGANGVTVYYASDYNAQLLSRNRLLQQDASFSLSSIKSLCNQVWGTDWE